MQPRPAAVTAWRNTSSATSPAAKTPGMFVTVEPGADAVVRVRLRRGTLASARGIGDDFDALLATRRLEADEFFDGISPKATR